MTHKREIMPLTVLVLAVFTGMLVPVARSQSITQNFNAASGGTFLSDWNQNGPDAPNLYQNTTGGGLGGTNAVALTTAGLTPGDCTAMYRNTTFNLSIGTTATVSAYFLNVQPGSGTSGEGVLQLGFGSSAGDGSNDVHTGTAFNDNSGVDSADSNSLKNFISARVISGGAINFQTSVGGVTTDLAQSAAASLTSGNWYFLTATFTVSSTANTFSGTASLYTSDSNGNIGTKLETESTTMTNTVLWNDSTSYAGFRAVSQPTQLNSVGLVDNFSASATPEPASAVLLLSGGALLILRRRRSQRR